MARRHPPHPLKRHNLHSQQNEHFAKDPTGEGEKLYKFVGLKMPPEVRADLQDAKEEEKDTRSSRATSPQNNGSVRGNRTATAKDTDAADVATTTRQRRRQLLIGQQQEALSRGEGFPRKEWSDVLSQAQGKEVQAICKSIMPSKLYKMVFVA